MEVEEVPWIAVSDEVQPLAYRPWEEGSEVSLTVTPAEATKQNVIQLVAMIQTAVPAVYSRKQIQDLMQKRLDAAIDSEELQQAVAAKLRWQ